MDTANTLVKVYGVKTPDKFKLILIGAVKWLLKDRFRYEDGEIKTITATPMARTRYSRSKFLHVISYFSLKDADGCATDRCLFASIRNDGEKINAIGLYKVSGNNLWPLNFTRPEEVMLQDDSGSGN